MISCEKAALICNKAQYKEASWLDKLKLKLHLLYCGTCSAFSKKNAKLTALTQKAKLRGLSEQEKTEMKRRLHEHGH